MKLQEDAWGAALSPDDSQIAFYRASPPEIWSVSVSGGQPRKLVVAPPGYGFGEELAWSADGRRIVFDRRNDAGDQSAIQAYDLSTGQTSVILSDPQVEEFAWTRNGRMFYARREDPPNQGSYNLWEVRVDPRTAEVRGTPRRLTNWNGFNFRALDASANGRRLSFVNSRGESNVYAGELANGGARLSTPRRLTFDEWIDSPTGWTRDSNSILFHSDRNGTFGIFRQPVTGGDAQALTTGGEGRDARLSPDGRWILYLAWLKSPAETYTGEGRLMRADVATGLKQVVLPVAGYTGLAPVENPVKRFTAAEGYPRFRCPSVPDLPCVLSARVGNEIVFTAFDPLRGSRGELTRIPVDRSRPAFWDLSPDGRWIAFGTCEESTGRIQLVSLAGKPQREISLGTWTNLTSAAWASNGKALFVTGWRSKGGPLLQASLDGKTRLLYKAGYYLENPVPSPDGRLLAFGEVRVAANAWIVDNPPDP